MTEMKKKEIEEIGTFNVLLIGENPHAISIADNIHSTFSKGVDNMKNNMEFNIVDEAPVGNSWFNEFIFDLTGLVKYNNVIVSSRFNDFIFELSTTATKYNNIVVSEKFKDWMKSPMAYPKRLYMKKLLQAMNFVIVDISKPDVAAPTDRFGGGGGYETVFDYDIPQCRFNENTDFLGDVVGWIDGQISKVAKKAPLIRLVRSLCGKNIPFLERSTAESSGQIE